MAQVLLARATGIEGFERYVVIKQIHVERARDPNVVKMFIDEARLAATLHHANIVQVHDIGQQGGDYFFAMEYLHGEDLRSLLHKLSQSGRHLPLEHVITIATSAAAALHHAHEQLGPDRQPLHIVHRDVSPANIFVCYDGNVKVVDFGIAKAEHRSTETHSGTLKGKISYMAPEQCMGQDVDRRSDVFALGIVLYELYTVRRLFKASSEFLTMSAIVSGSIPRPSVHRADIPPELEAIMMKALALSPSDRFQTADEMRQALDRLAAKLHLRTSMTSLADYMASTFGRRPEPWLDEDDDGIEILDVDFDGSASGVVNGDQLARSIATPPPGSLLARAKDKHRLRGATETATNRFDPRDEAPTTGSGTPMAWETPFPSAPKRRRWPVALGAIVVLGVAAGAFVVVQGSGDELPAAAVPTPAAQRAAAPSPIAQPRTEPVAQPADPTQSEPAIVKAPSGAGANDVVATPKNASGSSTNDGVATPKNASGDGKVVATPNKPAGNDANDAVATPKKPASGDGNKVVATPKKPAPKKPLTSAKPTGKPTAKPTNSTPGDADYDPDALFIKKPAP
jgi:serine/threonine protein kinase